MLGPYCLQSQSQSQSQSIVKRLIKVMNLYYHHYNWIDNYYKDEEVLFFNSEWYILTG
jgi:hypothetical protein